MSYPVRFAYPFFAVAKDFPSLSNTNQLFLRHRQKLAAVFSDDDDFFHRCNAVSCNGQARFECVDLPCFDLQVGQIFIAIPDGAENSGAVVGFSSDLVAESVGRYAA